MSTCLNQASEWHLLCFSLKAISGETTIEVPSNTKLVTGNISDFPTSCWHITKVLFPVMILLTTCS